MRLKDMVTDDTTMFGRVKSRKIKGIGTIYFNKDGTVDEYKLPPDSPSCHSPENMLY